MLRLSSKIVYDVIIVITIFVSFVKILNFQTSVWIVGNKHNSDITLREIFMSFIYIDICHQVNWCGGCRSPVTLYVSDESCGCSIIDVWVGLDYKVEI